MVYCYSLLVLVLEGLGPVYQIWFYCKYFALEVQQTHNIVGWNLLIDMYGYILDGK